MTKHVLLTYLSDVKMNRENPKEFIITYCKAIGATITTNESAVRYLLNQTWDEEPIVLDKIFCFASEKVKALIPTIEKTHIQVFKNRLEEVKALPKMETVLNTETIVDCSNDQSDVNGSIEEVVKMAAHIKAYINSLHNRDAKVIVHVDTTGGPRNAAMLVMAMMRLLHYQGISIGKVLYSILNQSNVKDIVEHDTLLKSILEEGKENIVQQRWSEVAEINAIYDMFDLIAGAEEFTRFGSVKALNDYFEKKETSSELKALLASMNQFADAIKISRRKEFEEAFPTLYSKLEVFIEASRRNPIIGSSAQDKLLLELAHRMHEDYRIIQESKIKELAIIEWCVEHGYLQQAMTLYTEIVPILLKEEGLFSIHGSYEKSQQKEILDLAKHLKAECSKEVNPTFYEEIDRIAASYYKKRKHSDKQNEPREKVFLALNVWGEAPSAPKKYEAKLKGLFNKCFTYIKKTCGKTSFSSVDEAWSALEQELMQYVKDLEERDIFVDEAEYKAYCEFFISIYLNEKAIRKRSQMTGKIKTLIEAFDIKYANEKEADIGKVLKNFASFVTQMEGNKAKEYITYAFYDKNFLTYKACDRFASLLKPGEDGREPIISLGIERGEFYKILSHYYEVKKIRNDSNHARKEQSATERSVSEVEAFIREGLADLKVAIEKVGVYKNKDRE